MNTFNTNILILLQVKAMVLMLSVIASCGDGQTNSSNLVAETLTVPPIHVIATPLTGSDSYTPKSNKQRKRAGKTRDLYADNNFQFNTYKVITLDINAIDDSEQALANTLLFVSALPDEVEQLDDQAITEKSLLRVFKTDASGGIYAEIEIASTVNKLLLELNTMGIENEVIVTLEQEQVVHHQFK